MTERPEFIDNLDGNTLAGALAALLKAQEGGATTPTLDIASAFFSPAGFAAVAGALDGVEHIRLLIGAEPPRDTTPPERRLGETPQEFERRVMREGLQELDAGLRRDRDRIPFTRNGRAAARRLLTLLESGGMETRRYEQGHLHAKAYVFGSVAGAEGGGVIAGSSNLTRAGLIKNLELNLGRYDEPIVSKARAWFERLWGEATPFDLAALLQEIFAPWTPWDVFLRTLYQLYGKEVEDLNREDQGLPLTSFQKHGVARALRLIRETGGAMVADEVGLGKTFIAGEIIDLYVKQRQRVLLICPAQLRDTTWRKFLQRFQIGIERVSYEQFAAGTLQYPADEYQLVVVDEAHNYRNPDTATRAVALRRLLSGAKRHVLLLTATPVNNSLWDLYHLIRFFLRQDAYLADRGILSIRERFQEAMQEDPSSLSPDKLYPIIDATTVKRTRQFVKKHYGGDTIRLPDGTEAAITFPKPEALSVRYSLEPPLPELFDLIERALDPDGKGALVFARYTPDHYRRGSHDPEIEARTAATVGLLRSGLLKRFESSAYAFRKTLEKLINEHRLFLDALGKGHVINTNFLREFAASSDESLDEFLDAGHETAPAGEFDTSRLKAAIEGDLAQLQELKAAAAKVTPDRDPKLKAIVAALEKIAAQAVDEAVDADDERQKRKVILFSSYSDTVRYLREELERVISANPRLAAYKDRIVAVSGGDDVEPDDVSRQKAVNGFAPISSEAPAGHADDLFDLMIATDVLAEGANLQQCRNVINADLPWNPMRLVQRHGRIDRIGSTHAKVFLRTVFPAERLDALLNLEARIMRKIAMAASSIGVARPIEGAATGEQVFSETREEIERLLAEDPTLFERGGTAGAAQTGEEYRQTLRKALADGRDRIVKMPWGVGSGMVKGSVQGVFFCAVVGERTYLRFVRTDANWTPIDADRRFVREIGTCLRLVECDATMPRNLPAALEQCAFDIWKIARDDVWEAWMKETDPANLQPRVRPLNQRVAEFIRANRPAEDDGPKATLALDILESPWPRREEEMLRGWFNDESRSGVEKARWLVERVLETGLEPFNQPPVLPPIDKDDVRLICWMGIAAAATDVATATNAAQVSAPVSSSTSA